MCLLNAAGCSNAKTIAPPSPEPPEFCQIPPQFTANEPMGALGAPRCRPYCLSVTLEGNIIGKGSAVAVTPSSRGGATILRDTFMCIGMVSWWSNGSGKQEAD